ncbi:MAG TPA: tryptophan 7-halogenase, partial [Woeseiaceae bacterium]|nr:tryptophan 7-halogenase [Woeseiaceae bacterium]
MNEPVARVAIVGRDAAAWLSALALQRSFGKAGVQVELIELPSALRPQDAYITLPTQQAFHRLLGLDETRLLRAASGLYSLGHRFSNWSGADAPFLHAYDTHGISLNYVDFLQYWLKARANGLKVPLEDFSLGAAAAKQGRFVIFNDSTQAFSKATYGYNLAAIPYLRTLGQAALGGGIRHTVADLRSVEHQDGRIRSVTLADGREVVADLYLDASGAEAALIRHLEPAGNFESWRRWLPCDRLAVASAPPLDPVPAFNQVSAFRAGWLGIYPLLGRTVLMAAYANTEISPQNIAPTIMALSGLRIQGDTILSPIEPGSRRQHWIGNCVAIGDTAASLDPLDAVQLHLLHTGLSYLVSMFPVDRHHMPEASVFNRKMESHCIGVRDYQAAHFKLNRRFGEPLWDESRVQEAPPTLARKLRLFSARGIVALE